MAITQEQATKTLPNVPSQIIRLALADLEKVERDARYEVDMGIWHQATKEDPSDYFRRVPRERCVVCLAGSVIAGSLGVAPDVDAHPEEFTEEAKLMALDELRGGDIDPLLDACGLDVPAGAPGYFDVPSYCAQPEEFKAALSRIADFLEARNL